MFQNISASFYIFVLASKFLVFLIPMLKVLWWFCFVLVCQQIQHGEWSSADESENAWSSLLEHLSLSVHLEFYDFMLVCWLMSGSCLCIIFNFKGLSWVLNGQILFTVHFEEHLCLTKISLLDPVFFVHNLWFGLLEISKHDLDSISMMYLDCFHMFHQ